MGQTVSLLSTYFLVKFIGILSESINILQLLSRESVRDYGELRRQNSNKSKISQNRLNKTKQIKQTKGKTDKRLYRSKINGK